MDQARLDELDKRQDRGELVDPREIHDDQQEQADRQHEHAAVAFIRYCRQCHNRWRPKPGTTLHCPRCNSLRGITNTTPPAA